MSEEVNPVVVEETEVSEEKSFGSYADELKDLPELPAWLNRLLPEIPKPAKLIWDNNLGEIVLKYPGDEDGGLLLGADLNKAYDRVEAMRDLEYVFDESLVKKFSKDSWGDLADADYFFGPSTTSEKYSRMYSSRNSNLAKKLLQDTYAGWLKLRKEYLEDQDDFMNAYYFVDGHPAFWTREFIVDNAPGIFTRDDLFRWQTNGHARKLTIEPFAREPFDDRELVDPKGNVVPFLFSVEGGMHVKDDGIYTSNRNYLHITDLYKNHYYDFKLDAYGATYEDAIINFAKLLEKYFDEFGEERPNIEREKTALENLLDERMADILEDEEDEDFDEDFNEDEELEDFVEDSETSDTATKPVKEKRWFPTFETSYNNYALNRNPVVNILCNSKTVGTAKLSEINSREWDFDGKLLQKGGNWTQEAIAEFEKMPCIKCGKTENHSKIKSEICHPVMD